ncbi:hypothetical protein ABZ807_09390 [Micromonospora sp. NPDC047548]|uniref:hypothetical protein n=1 Tax=Micromonospora sp. NPDC047548 TaxID=3155624 RepID=UPI0033C3CA0F
MSSNYHILCMNHDPAIVVDGGWTQPAVAITEARQHANEQLRHHQNCDLLVGRYSYPLIEVCCPGGEHNGVSHSQPEWVDADWLRLLYAAYRSQGREPEPAVARAVQHLARGCWGVGRVHRLRVELGIEDGGQP